jgi:hypothetical protein
MACLMFFWPVPLIDPQAPLMKHLIATLADYPFIRAFVCSILDSPRRRLLPTGNSVDYIAAP